MSEYAAWVDGARWMDHINYSVPDDELRFSRLAWEALRRNLNFNKFCDRVGLDGVDDWKEPLNANKWGLIAYKHYSCEFGGGLNQPQWIQNRPLEVIDLIRPISKGFGERRKTVRPGSQARKSVEIKYGQVAIVFDLEQTKYFKTVLERQIADARAQLDDLLKFIQKDTGVTSHIPAPKPEFVIPSLRIADAMMMPIPPSRVELAIKLFPGKFPELTENELDVAAGRAEPDPDMRRDAQKFMAERVQGAHDLIYGQGYIALLAKDGARKSSG